MADKRLDTMIEIAGGLLWLAPRSLGGLSPDAFSKIWMGGGSSESLESIIKRGAMMPLGLYQDDGYAIRFVQGSLTQQEKDEWTAHAAMNLDIPCGELLVSGVLTPDFATLEFPQIAEAEAETTTQFGCYLGVAPGKYRVDVYSYPPGDLSGGWGHIVDSKTFGKVKGLEAEAELKYFERTRPEETPPAWIDYGDDEVSYVSFLIQLSSFDSSLPPPRLGEDGVGLAWEFRKPAKFPLGVPLSFQPE